MYGSKLVTLLIELTPEERRRFKKWLRSPLHNANDTLLRLYTFIDSRENASGRSLKKERVFAKLFGDVPYDDLQMRRVMSELLQVFEGFLAYESGRERPVEAALARAQWYRSRQLSREAARWVDEAAACLERRPERHSRFYLDAYNIQEEKFRQTRARDTALNLQDMTDELCTFFAAEMLRNACTAASHQAIYRADYDMPYIEAILRDCAAGRYDRAPVIRLYYLCYICLARQGGTGDFLALKNMLSGAADWLPVVELRNVTVFAINYCIRRLNTDAPAFMRDVFDIYRTGLGQGIFLENGEMSRFTYKNIVAAALKLGETEWTAQFIREYTPKLARAFRTDYEKFCTAKLCYRLRDYTRVQTLLHGVGFDDVFLELDARVLLLKIYFETAEWRLLRGFLTTFGRFVGRKKMMAYHAPNYLNIIHLTGRLMQIRSGQRPPTAEETDALLAQIRAVQPLTEREWLEEMALRS